MKLFQLILVVLIAWFLFSCSGTKKNQRAVNRVKADINMLNDVGNSWQQLHPCIIDTIVQFKDGIEIIRYDTLDNYHTDTVYNVDTQTQVVYKTVVKYVNKTDTFRVYVQDRRGEQTAIDNLNILQGKYDQQAAQLTATQKQSTKKTWYLIGAGALFILLTFLRIKRVI